MKSTASPTSVVVWPDKVAQGPWSVRIVRKYFQFRAAWILGQERRRTGLSLLAAAKLANLEPQRLARYEWGRESPPLFVIADLLRVYRADESAVLFFCTMPFPCYGIDRLLGLWWRRFWLFAKSKTV